MLRDYPCGSFQKLNAPQNLLAMQRMLPHMLPFFFRQLRRLAEDGIRHANLSNVMKQRTKLECFHLWTSESVLPAQAQTEGHNAL